MIPFGHKKKKCLKDVKKYAKMVGNIIKCIKLTFNHLVWSYIASTCVLLHPGGCNDECPTAIKNAEKDFPQIL